MGTEPPPDPDDKHVDLEGVFKVWIDSDLKVQILVFFHNNPGMIETPHGLARRMGLSIDALKQEISDHIRLGIIAERQVGDKTVLVYNQRKERDVADYVQKAIEQKMREDHA